jgi:Putative adhesin
MSSQPLFRALVVSLLLLPTLSSAQSLVGRSDSVYTWRGPIPSGAQLTVRNYNGPIDVRAASGGATTAEIRAEKRPGRSGGDIRDVAFDVTTSRNGDVVVCSTFRDNDPCDEDRHGWNNDDDSGGRRSVTVAMTVLVPRGVLVKVTTGNGAVAVERAGGEVSATTGNGRVQVSGTDGLVRVSTGNGDVVVRDAKAAVRVTTGNGRVTVTTAEGPVDASTGNGDIDVQIGALRSTESMGFHTGSGSVRVTLPASYNGDLDATTGNGEIRSDFDLKVQGRMSSRRVRATIGNGGPMLRLTTGNGQLELRKAQ